jgi:hypothetical protein
MKRKSPADSKYPENWKEIAQSVKDDAGWKCVRCGHAHDPKLGYTLTVHHLDIDPRNCAWWNLPALCQRCHLSIQNKVVMEREWMFEHSDWFKPYAAAYYAQREGLTLPTMDYDTSLKTTPRRMVKKHLNEWLALGKAQETQRC